MDALLQKTKSWFFSLNPRERVMVSVGGALVVLVAIYTLALGPFYKALNDNSERVARKQTDLAWLRGVAGEVQALGANQPVSTAPAGESLVVLVDRMARECGLGTSLTGQTPNGETGIRVRLEAAAFDVLVKCLGNLQQAHSVSIESATIDRTGQPGLVNASLVLNRTSS